MMSTENKNFTVKLHMCLNLRLWFMQKSFQYIVIEFRIKFFFKVYLFDFLIFFFYIVILLEPITDGVVSRTYWLEREDLIGPWHDRARQIYSIQSSHVKYK